MSEYRGTAMTAMTTRTIVKLCGLRTLDDARAATDAGADVLSFTFYAGSRRYIAPQEAGAIIAALRAEAGPHPLICGLFVNETAATVRKTAAQCGLDLVQLAGDESPENVRAVEMPTLKSFRPQPGETAPALAERIVPYLDIVPSLPPGPFGQPLIPLLDAAVPGTYGGTGHTADWALCAAFIGLPAPGSHRVMLAGGLTPETVGAAVRIVRPWGVDVASGIERAPGVKDAARMTAFVQAVRAADREA